MKKSKILFVFISLLVTSAFICVSAEGADTDKKATSVIEQGSHVTLHYTLTVDGKEFDSSRDRKPMEFDVGSGKIIPAFEKAIMGMKVGEKKSFKVSPKDGYGDVNPDGIQEVPRDDLPEGVNLEVGMTLSAQDQSGQRFPARIEKIKGDVVVLNFNHPLAGKTLKFDVEIISIN